MLVAAGLGVAWTTLRARSPHEDLRHLPLRVVADLPLGGGSSRFDYLSLDPTHDRLYLAHLGADLVTVVDVRRRMVLADIVGIPAPHGVLVVPRLGRTIPLGGEAGNVTVDSDGPSGAQVLVAVQSRNRLAVINPRSQQIVRSVRLPGCDHDHGLLLDMPHRLAFVACDGNARLLLVDLATWQVTASYPVGRSPDVLAFDPGLGLLYVASESGTVTVFAETQTANSPDQGQGRRLVRRGTGVMPHAHAVAVDPRTHLVYLPLEREGSQPVLRIMAPTPSLAGAGGGS